MDTANRQIGRAALVPLLLATALLLPACDATRDQLGLSKKAPDEFTVVTKAPLVIPPDFALRPPAPGAKRPQEVQAEDAARSAVVAAGAANGQRPTREASAGQARQTLLATGFDGSGGTEAPSSQAEVALLRQARADDADPEIREIVNRETTVLAQKDKSFTDKLLFWQEKPPFGSTLDATQEAQRLREAAAEGRAPNEGQTPVITHRKRGWLEGIF